MRAWGWGDRSVGPTASRRRGGRTRTRTGPAPWGCRRGGPGCRRCGRPGRRAGAWTSVTAPPPLPVPVRTATTCSTGGEDPAVAGAAAEVAGQRLPDLERSGLRHPVEQVVDRDHEPGRAEPALHAPGLDHGLLHVGEHVAGQGGVAGLGAGRGRPSTVVTAQPAAASASSRQAHTSTPSTSTEHEPHSPCSQAFLAPGRPSRSRRTWSRLSPAWRPRPAARPR